ncbi:E3 ubiquitin-protein ligase TRIM71-like [Crassostrea angulata]|uniref:E3 ubiquitin-protein ligase TRIM71-like n=1 Tax=Magallana angulata TaxID=2784310 RepID=UPI0022B08F7D|nr:E3 ubiquitin-protein ligase TRIM71-like [Crassostrea angulata]
MATNTAQDAVRCSLCTEVVVFLCGSCHVNLCGQCLPTHLDKNKSLKHEILSYTSESVQSKPQAPECQDHPGESRKLYCQDCNVPICSQCLIMTGNHNRHGAVKLADFWEKTRNIIMEDLIELHHFEKEYSMIVKDRENKIKKYTEHSNQEKILLKKRGQELYQILTKAIETIEHELTDMVKEDLQILQNDKDKVQHSYQVIKDCIERNEHILNEENSFKMLEYKSIVEELRLVPSMKDISPPKLILPDVKKEEIIKQVVSLQSSVHSTLPGFTISKTGDVTMVSTLTMMEEPTLLAVLLTHCTKLKGICCESKEKVWIYGDDEKIKQLDRSGNALNSFNAASGTSQKDIAMNSDGNIAFSHKEDACIYLVKKTKIEKFVDVSCWIPYGLCFNSDGDLMVCMRRNDYTESKVGVFADGKLKQQFQFDDIRKPLFSISRNSMYICENGNGDICVSDWNACAVIVMKKSGEYRFRYTGCLSRSFKEFYPHGIATDSSCRILIADRDNNCVHVTDRNGKFVRYITCGLQDPFVLSLDTEENLWVGECDTACIKIIKYLE